MTDELPRMVDLNWIARTLLNMQADVRSLKDDNLVSAALLNRLDSSQSAIIATQQAMIAEMRASRAQFDRMRLEHERLRSRVDALEEPDPDRARP